MDVCINAGETLPVKTESTKTVVANSSSITTDSAKPRFVNASNISEKSLTAKLEILFDGIAKESGTISLEELKAYYTSQGLKPPQFIDTVFSRLD